MKLKNVIEKHDPVPRKKDNLPIHRDFRPNPPKASATVPNNRPTPSVDIDVDPTATLLPTTKPQKRSEPTIGRNKKESSIKLSDALTTECEECGCEEEMCECDDKN